MKKPVKQKNRRIRQSQRRSAAEKGIKGNMQLHEVRPHLDFLNRSQGSLPETITEGDLATLNSGLGFLFARLREARQQHDEDEDGGRVAAITALGAMWQFITLFKSPFAEGLHVPILKLMDALAALDQNNVLPVLRPVARAGRAPSSHAYAALQGHAAGTVMRLRMLGVDPKQARALVAQELTKLGVKPDRGKGGITGNTVRHWCDHVDSDVARTGTAAIMYDKMFTDEEVKRFRALSPAKARAFALASLRQYVRAIFPELRVVADKPS